MSCRCENRQRAMELDRTRRLAKALARLEGENVCIYRNQDGTYGFDVRRNLIDLKEYNIIEIVTKY